MFTEYILELSHFNDNNRIMLIDENGLDETMHYSDEFAAHGFEVVRYEDDLSFRFKYEDRLKNTDDKILVISDSMRYIPYDLRRILSTYSLSFDQLFKKLNIEVLKEYPDLDLDLLCLAYKKNFDDCRKAQKTKDFLREKVYIAANVKLYLDIVYPRIDKLADSAQNYRDWIKVAESKAHIDVLATEYHIDIDTSELNKKFQSFILGNFNKLSAENNKETPVLVSRAMEYIHEKSEKFVVIVMDGMSEFDWEVLSGSFSDIPYKRASVYAMIPTTTSISRQCLLSNKLPVQLLEPWKQSKEKQEFMDCAQNMGYRDNQIGYERGYGATFDLRVRCGAVIINDIDNMVHGQQQGKYGMLSALRLLAEKKELAEMAKGFLRSGFDVYITADHGNTNCIGCGKLTNMGVSVETKGHRMLVLKNFANKAALQQQYGLINYPGYYLDQEYDYLICDIGDSLDVKGANVMTHGGMSMDEVIVPFIKIKASDING